MAICGAKLENVSGTKSAMLLPDVSEPNHFSAGTPSLNHGSLHAFDTRIYLAPYESLHNLPYPPRYTAIRFEPSYAYNLHAPSTFTTAHQTLHPASSPPRTRTFTLHSHHTHNGSKDRHRLKAPPDRIPRHLQQPPRRHLSRPPRRKQPVRLGRVGPRP
jgi:hypothetical protein